jgi:hypothetical protein
MVDVIGLWKTKQSVILAPTQDIQHPATQKRGDINFILSWYMYVKM